MRVLTDMAMKPDESSETHKMKIKTCVVNMSCSMLLDLSKSPHPVIFLLTNQPMSCQGLKIYNESLSYNLEDVTHLWLILNLTWSLKYANLKKKGC